MNKHWTKTFFIDNGDLLLYFLKDRDSHASLQVEQLIQNLLKRVFPLMK